MISDLMAVASFRYHKYTIVYMYGICNYTMYKKSSKVQGQSLLFPLITCNNNLTHAQIHTTNSAYLRYIIYEIKGSDKIKSGCVHIYKEGNTKYEPLKDYII